MFLSGPQLHLISNSRNKRIYIFSELVKKDLMENGPAAVLPRAVVPPLCCRGATAVLPRWCCRVTAAVVLPRCAAVLLRCCHAAAALVPQWCRSAAAVLPRWCRSVAADSFVIIHLIQKILAVLSQTVQGNHKVTPDWRSTTRNTVLPKEKSGLSHSTSTRSNTSCNQPFSPRGLTLTSAVAADLISHLAHGCKADKWNGVF
jgi:hypothetical protein